MNLLNIQRHCILCISLIFFLIISRISIIATNSEPAQQIQDVDAYYKNFILGANQSVVLVLGNKGSGKSILTRLLTTDSEQINVKGTKLEFYGQRNVPETHVPTLFIDRITNTSFYDCPTVDDDDFGAAVTTAEIAAALSVQKLLAHAREFKIVFVITAESMYNVNETDAFIKLAERAVDLIKDIRKYSDGIALIVRKTEANGTSIEYDAHRDRELIGKLIDFLKRTQLKLARPRFQLNMHTADVDPIAEDQEEADERANREKISFISALFKRDRIKILRIPMRAGALRRQNDEIRAMINNELRFVTKDDDDFLCKISEKSKQEIPALLAALRTQLENAMPNSITALHTFYVQAERRDEITLNVMAEVLAISERLLPNSLKLPPNIDRNHVISRDLQRNIDIFDFLQQFNSNDEMRALNISIELRNQLRHEIDRTFSIEMISILDAIKSLYFQKTKDYSLEIDKISGIVAEAHAKFAKISSETRETFMFELLNEIVDHEIDGLNGNMRRLLRNYEFMIVLSDANQPIADQYLADEFVEWKGHFYHLKIWYEFLRELRDQLSIYAVQQRNGVVTVPFMKVYIVGDDDDTVGPHIIELQTPLSYLANDSSVDRNAIENVRVNRYMLHSLQTIWSNSMSELSIECENGTRIRVMGDFVSVRHAIDTAVDCWSMAGQIEIFALNTVFIDADIDKRDTNINLTIIAPTVEIIESPEQQLRQILLIGKNISEELPAAKNGSVDSNRNGTSGMQGIRGGAGGNILCIGHWFLNDQHLRIDVGGGKGGTGQTGGNGEQNMTKLKWS